MTDEPKTSREVVAEAKGIPVDEVPRDVGAAEVLEATTGKPKEEFEADIEEYPMPDLDDLERIPAEEFHSDCGCMDDE